MTAALPPSMLKPNTAVIVASHFYGFNAALAELDVRIRSAKTDLARERLERVVDEIEHWQDACHN